LEICTTFAWVHELKHQEVRSIDEKFGVFGFMIFVDPQLNIPQEVASCFLHWTVFMIADGNAM